MQNETRSRPVWLFILAAILLVVLIVLIGRGCRDEYGETPPPGFTDTLDVDADTTLQPGGDDGFPDTTNGGMRDDDASRPSDTIVNPVAPSAPVSPGSPTVMPGTSPGGMPGGM